MEKTWLMLSVLALTSMVDAAKILAIFPMPGKSHGILGEGVVRHLLNAGHEVTYITPFPKNNPNNTQLHEIDVSANAKIFEEVSEYLNIKAIMDGVVDTMDQSIFFLMMNGIAKTTLENENVQKLLKDQTQHFDLIFAEWMFGELWAGLSGLYNAHLVWFSTIEPHWMVLNLIDEYTNPAYNPYIVDEDLPFTFGQRVKELFFTIRMTLVRETIGYYLQYREYNNIFVPLIESRGRVAPSFSELRYNGSLMLGNSHVSMGFATRLPQNYKPIGGYHIHEKVKPLPEDLQKLLDNAKYGVIYFSMGSNLKSKDMPDEIKISLLNVFASLKQTVLWKFEEKLPNLPENVKILDWAPQQSILAHPNCVLFITHGGLLSTTETIFAGKPIIGIPVFADQFANVARAVTKGFARRVDLSYDMSSKLKIEIEEILSNPKYAKKAKELSFIYHDRPVSPSKELVHWVNHVLATDGAPHLRSAALMLPWYQKWYLDLAAIVIIALYVLIKVLKLVISVVRPKKLSPKKTN